LKTLSRENGRGKREMGLARVTIKDVAEAAGVGVSTASRALNNRRDVSEKTRRHVLAVAERLGYVPNSLARGLLLGKTKTIGVVVSSILNPFYAAVVRGSKTAFPPTITRRSSLTPTSIPSRSSRRLRC